VTAGPNPGTAAIAASDLPVKVFDQDARAGIADSTSSPSPPPAVPTQREERRSPLSKIVRRFRLGLRARTTFALALLSLLISVAVSSLTYFVARTSFVKDRRINYERLAFANAEVATRALITGDQNMNLVIERIDAESGLAASSLLVVDGKESSKDGSLLLRRDIPQSLRDTLAGADPAAKDPGAKDAAAAYQIIDGPDGARLIVGVTLPKLGNIQFYEIASMSEVEAELRRLARALALAAFVSTVGAALIGRAVSARVVAPLRDVADAAADITKGQFDTRLLPTGDVDLDPLLRSFNAMTESLQGRLEREARFASDVSHELRTPLTALSTAAQLLHSRRDEIPERSQRALDVLVTQTAHFERLVLDLLEISRFDAGAAELHREVLDLPAFVEHVMFLNDSEAELDTSGLSAAEATLDKRRLERIVANLLQNAATYAGGATQVVLGDRFSDSDGGDLQERTIEIIVEDSGPGVPDEEKPVVFERFRRGKAHLRGTFAQKGTGLGLSLVAAHAALHDGSVRVEDRPGGGARFVVTLVDQDLPEHGDEDIGELS
jgi:two-component system, OmpR family, sensor histidine kinase MtrB